MHHNYLITALRNFACYKLYSFINVTDLMAVLRPAQDLRRMHAYRISFNSLYFGGAGSGRACNRQDGDCAWRAWDRKQILLMR